MNAESVFSTRWPDFKLEEILSPAQLEYFRRKGIFPYSFRSLDKLQQFRTQVGKPFLINHGHLMRRGARSMTEVWDINSQTRGRARAWEYSYHLWCAFDISVAGMTTDDLFRAAVNFGAWGGVGKYDTFVHVDDRDYFGLPARWVVKYDKK